MSISILFMDSKQGLRIELVWLGMAILVQTIILGLTWWGNMGLILELIYTCFDNWLFDFDSQNNRVNTHVFCNVDIRDIRKVRARQHQNLEFGHKQGETQNTINFGGSLVSSCLSFFLSASSTVTYIFTAPTCTTSNNSRTLCIRCWESVLHTQI